MNKLTNVINYLQHNDRNGTYEDMIEEIENGELTIEEARECCIDTLKQWQEDNINDIKYYNRFQNLIDSLNN